MPALASLTAGLLAGSALLAAPVHAQSVDGNGQDTQLRPIVITGEGEEDAGGKVNSIVAKKTATAGKTGRAIVRTPQTVNVVGRVEMEQRGAQSVTEALRYTPGVVAETRPATRYDIGYIRGFGGLQNWFDFVDGMKMQRGISYNAPSMDAWNLERVEVLKGPASVLYGQIMPGGLVNQVTKKPGDEAANEVQLTTGHPGRAEAAFDFTGPVPGTEGLKYRLVGLGRYLESNIDSMKSERFFIAPSLTWDIADDTSLTVYGGYLRDPSSVYPVFLPAFGTVLANAAFPKIPYDFNAEDGDYASFTRDQAWAGYEFVHNFNDRLKFTQKLRFMDTETDFRSLGVVGLSGTSISRRASHTWDDSRQVSIDNQLQYDVETGEIRHRLLAGLDYQYLDAERYTGEGAIYGLDYTNPVYASITVPDYTSYHEVDRHQIGLYLQDQIEIGRLSAVFGGRHDWVSYDYDANSYNAATGAATPLARGSVEKSFGDFSWHAGASYLFDNGIAPYASYATSFEVFSGTGPGGSAYKPTTAKQFEIGVKYQPDDFPGLFTLSYFDIEQKNVLTSGTSWADYSDTSCSTTPCRSQLGKVRSQGVELEAKAQILPGLDLVASYAYVHARVKEDAFGPLVDTAPAGIPTHQASAWAHYRFGEDSPLGGLGLGLGVRYIGESKGAYLTGSILAPEYHSITVPSYTLVDAALSYDFGVKNPDLKGLNLNVTAANLFDKEYVASCATAANTSTANPYALAPVGQCYYGTARTVKATLSFKW